MELHIIVHEEAVRTYANLGSKAAQKVIDEIQNIKENQSYLEIGELQSPNELHNEMPPPSEDLRVIVSGGYEQACCTFQLFILRESGYQAKFHPTAKYRSSISFTPGALLSDIEENYPDFYSTEW